MKSSCYIFGLLLFCLVSCKTEPKTDLITIDILEGMKTEKEFRLSEVVDNVEYVKLETTKECLISWAQYIVGQQYIVAVQSYNPAQVYLFDQKGKFIRKIGSEGKGPSEYTSLSSVAVDPEETYILVNDYQKDLILKYNLEGEVVSVFKYKEKLGGEVADILIKNSDEIWFRLDYPPLEATDFYLLRKVDRNFIQIDSLYPVTCTTTPGNGRSWSSSDFYLKNGAVQFRQFSFDTLYGESKGKLIPRIYFPIKANHLPGPYLVNEIHKQMYEYSFVDSFCELSDYVFLSARIVPRKGGGMVYNKSTGEIFKLKKYPPCPPDTLGRRYFMNDIDGIIHPSTLFADQNLCIHSFEIIDLKNWMNSNCVDNPEIKFPSKRQEFVELINASNEEDNPILQIFHLKK
jgi:hypothetical protein